MANRGFTDFGANPVHSLAVSLETGDATTLDAQIPHLSSLGQVPVPLPTSFLLMCPGDNR